MLQIHFLTEKLTEAKEDFEKSISLNPSFVPAKIQLAYCIYKSALIAQAPILAQGAVEMMEKVVESHPDSPDAISLYAQVCTGSVLTFDHYQIVPSFLIDHVSHYNGRKVNVFTYTQ